MRRLVFLIAFLALAMPVSLAAANHGPPVNHVFVDATLEFPPYTVQYTIDVTGDPLTFVASGSFRQHTFGGGVDLDMQGSVDCLRVVGDTAYISGAITAGNQVPIGTPFYTPMRDTSADGTGDMIGATFAGPGNMTCLAAQPPAAVIASGNIVIEQCDWVNGSGKCKTKD